MELVNAREEAVHAGDIENHPDDAVGLAFRKLHDTESRRNLDTGHLPPKRLCRQ
jgi:hypothetical protein